MTMMKFMMQKMMPMMSGTIGRFDYAEKEKMMDKMMPHMLSNMTIEEKMKMMSKMMPLMMQNIDMNDMEKMMDTMMPSMIEMMQQKGIDVFQMMNMMCPKCVLVATSNFSEEDKSRLKSQMADVFANI
jgi:hypothetical protein